MQDIFCGKETVVHVKRGAEAPSAQAIEAALVALGVLCEGVRRDDSAVM